jgi:predicted nucleic acid-binding protein
MIVVCDASPANYLVLIGQIDLLPRLFAEVVFTPGVVAELQHPRTPAAVATWARDLPPWARVVAPDGPIEELGLGRGEAEVIAVARPIAANAVLIDERKPAGLARRRGLLVTGTLGFSFWRPRQSTWIWTKASAGSCRPTSGHHRS